MEMKKISESVEGTYLDGHLRYIERAVKEMRKAINEDNAGKFIDEFSRLQWHERSVFVGSKKLMKQLGFSEKDLGLIPLNEYKE